jgi:microcystin-dependent protein
MAEPFIGQIIIVGFTFAPRGYAFCNGQIMAIAQNTALFSLLGTTYGGNGQTTFALPDLRGRAPLHIGNGFTQGQAGGQEFHTVTISEMPAHNHFVNASNLADGTNSNSPNGNFPANSSVSPYRTSFDTTLHPAEVTNLGGSQPHENRQPSLVVNFIIALQGVFPSQN